jgi:hypothetical protein
MLGSPTLSALVRNLSFGTQGCNNPGLTLANTFGVWVGGCNNPGLKLANTFGVSVGWQGVCLTSAINFA